MQIVINVSAYYDWEATTDTPNQEDLLALRYKPGQDGKWLKKVVKEKETQTEVNMPEAEIQDCMAHFARVGMPRTRARVVAWYLEEKIMPHHAHPDHWASVVVHDEPEIETALNKYFNLDKEVPVPPPVPQPAPEPVVAAEKKDGK